VGAEGAVLQTINLDGNEIGDKGARALIAGEEKDSIDS
jgi:hypothetical protein